MDVPFARRQVNNCFFFYLGVNMVPYIRFLQFVLKVKTYVSFISYTYTTIATSPLSTHINETINRRKKTARPHNTALLARAGVAEGVSQCKTPARAEMGNPCTRSTCVSRARSWASRTQVRRTQLWARCERDEAKGVGTDARCHRCERRLCKERLCVGGLFCHCVHGEYLLGGRLLECKAQLRVSVCNSVYVCKRCVYIFIT